ncbi:transcription elongation factor B polypeptide 3 [Anopheles darlingi]|uniref:transcription elongation factor B polypeptide 3 n=1 Tax=Anopheles darlingi TaxID=43151 RepID=UPI0021001F79|nr:transcription elongation factor B polypeptide 3 [Anopheles darlingi]
MTSIVDVINHYQTSINKSLDDKARIVHCIGKLYKLPISVRHLQDTGIGRTVNSLRKYDGEVGTAAKALVTKWKAMVAAEESDDGSGSQNNTSDMDNNDQHPERNERSDEEDAHADETAEETHHGTLQHYGEHHGVNDAGDHSDNGDDKDTSYEESQLRVDEEYRDALESGNNSSSEEESDGPTSHQLHRTQDTAYRAKPDGERWSSSSHQGSIASSMDEKHSSTSRSHHHHSSSSKSRSSSHKQSSSKSHDDDRRRHHREEESKSHKVSSSSSRSEHGSGRKSSHGDSTDSRQKEHSSSKHHNTESSGSSSNNGVATERGSKSSSEKRKDSSQKDRSKNERDSGGSSKRSAADSGSQDSKRSRKDSVGSPSSSSSHSKKSSKESSSTSSSKHRDRHEKSSSAEKSHKSSDSKSKRKEQKSKKHQEEDVNAEESHEEDTLEGMDGAGGASFADALSMIGMPSTSKKKQSGAGSREKITIIKSVSSPSAGGGHSSKSRLSTGSSSSAGKSSIPTAQELLSSKAKLQPLPEAAEIVEALPMISPNYRPMPLNQTVMDCVFLGGSQSGGRGQRRPLTEEEALGQSMQSKNMRTKVYSGMKSTNVKGVIPTLYDLCIRLLQDHIDELGATGGIPFYILKPVLERATPNQLLHLEHHNPQFVEDSDVLWEQHCKRTFRSKQRNEEELETWREMYLRCCDERDAKLKSLTQNIKLSQEQAAAPIRKTQLAYVDSAAKPPRAVINKQARYGTARAPVVSPAARVAALKSGNVAQVGDARLRVLPGARDNAQAQVFQPTKPRKAPMMAKVLSSMKGFKTSFRR